uniref:Protein-serine O-palmitoleoyltransferase porcupine n=1 Tax=Aceria tosichella TaxID=561515 RepID=A0A6G1SBR2_9ACAR
MNDATKSVPTDVSMDNFDFDDSRLVPDSDLDYSYEDVSAMYEVFRQPSHPLIYFGLKLIWGPLNILIDYREIIVIALAARLITSMLEISSFPSKKILKQLALIMLGIYQIDRYLRRSCPDLPFNTTRGMIYTLALTYASYSAVTNRFRTLLTKAKIRNQTVICTISLHFVAFAPLLYNEYRVEFGKHNKQYCFLRALFMSMAMKLISLTTVVDRHKSPLSLLAYLIHPASTVMGVWHPYEAHNSTELLHRESHWLTSITHFGRQLLKIVLVLLISANVSELVDYIDSTTLSYEFKLVIRIYLIALEFRFSHYFSCYLASSFLSPFKHHESDHGELCDMMKVEWPRSLVDVVTQWNILMHLWLKRYIFKRVMRYSNTGLAIMSTYLVSSILHGFKFHIWSVLLTLGLLTWTEYNLRLKLANSLNACVEAQPCRYKRNLRTGRWKCIKGHSLNPDNSFLVKLTNVIFKLNAMMQLAYLGYIFVGNTDEATYLDAIQRWSSIYFYGHWMGLITLLISLAI